jgi:outer membrane protein OmpA-like peptidoglycan-associated protein
MLVSCASTEQLPQLTEVNQTTNEGAEPQGIVESELPPPPPPPAPPPPPYHCNKGPYIVFFGSNEAEISGEAENVLDDAIRAYERCYKVLVEISGYTDRTGNAAYNLELAGRRNAAVAEYFMNRGIAEANLSIEALGETNNRIPTADGVQEIQNRRVEISFVEGAGS